MCKRKNRIGVVLDQLLALLDIKSVVISSKINGADVAPDFTTNGTGAELIWDRRLGVDGELNLTALA